MEPGKRHALRAHIPEAATNWLNPLSLGTMSASAYIENLAKNSAHLMNYQEITRSIKLFLVWNGAVWSTVIGVYRWILRTFLL